MSYTFLWDPAKSDALKASRGLSFEEFLEGEFLLIQGNPSRRGQSLMLCRVRGYVWAAPCVMRAGEIFLKTMYPSRKYTRLWGKGGRA